MNDISRLRRRIAGLAPTKPERRYSPELRRELAARVRSHPERGVSSLARALDMAPATLTRIASSEGPKAFALVRVVDDGQNENSLLVVRGPHDLVVEGLDINGVAALFRALSC